MPVPMNEGPFTTLGSGEDVRPQGACALRLSVNGIAAWAICITVPDVCICARISAMSGLGA